MITAGIAPLPEAPAGLENKAAARRTTPAAPEGEPAAGVGPSPFAAQLAALLGRGPGPSPAERAVTRALPARAEREPVAPEAARSLLARPGSGFRLPAGREIPLILLPTRETGQTRSLLFRLPETALLAGETARTQARELDQAPVRTRITGRGASAPQAAAGSPGHGARPKADRALEGVIAPAATDTGIREQGHFRSLVQQAGEARSEVRDLRSLLETLSGQIRFLVEEGSGRGESLIRLKPPELGVVKVNLVQHGDGVAIRIQVEHAAPRQLLESRLGELQESLGSAGIRLEKLELVEAGRGQGPGQDGDSGSGGEGHPGQRESRGRNPERDPRPSPRPGPGLESELREVSFRERLQAGLSGQAVLPRSGPGLPG